MNDGEFLLALESCTLPESEFGHAAHVRAGYLYLRAVSFGQAIDRMADTIRRYAGSLGRSDRYHETITVGFLALIHERLRERGDGGGWAGFATANPELLDRGVLLRHYSAEQLQSTRARRVFVLPETTAPAH
jgi:hypothetical protein